MSDAKAIRQVYIDGKTIRAIRAEFGCSANAVRRAARGLPHRRPKVSPAQCLRIQRLALAGVSTRDIGRVTGHCSAVIARESKKANDAGPALWRTALESENERLREAVKAMRAALEAAGVS